MIEANNRLPQATTLAQAQTMSRAVMVLARQRAVKGAKRQFQAQGLKPQRMAWKEIAAAGDVAAPWSICSTLSRPSRLVGSICTSINKQSTLLRQAAS